MSPPCRRRHQEEEQRERHQAADEGRDGDAPTSGSSSYSARIIYHTCVFVHLLLTLTLIT